MDIVTVLIRLSLAMVLGGVVGLERQSKHRPAGFRTHILVCIGSSLIMCLTEYMFIEYSTKYGVKMDVFRMGAQVISGIGFLGAGTIMNFGASIKGLTTAAGLWSVACIGLAVGAGFYTGAVVATGLIVITLLLFSRVSQKFDEFSHTFEIILETLDKPEPIGEITLYLGRSRIKILDLEYLTLNADLENKTFKLILQSRQGAKIDSAIADMTAIDGVIRIERV